MTRITQKDLEAVVKRINTITGMPLEPYAKSNDPLAPISGYMPQAGCYHLSGAYGGVALHRMSMTPECTGVNDVFSSGHMTKRELYDRMQSFISGLYAAKEL